jgi:hypothetical protein
VGEVSESIVRMIVSATTDGQAVASGKGHVGGVRVSYVMPLIAAPTAITLF